VYKRQAQMRHLMGGGGMQTRFRPLVPILWLSTAESAHHHRDLKVNPCDMY